MKNEQLAEIKQAWARGEEIQYLFEGEWRDWGADHWIDVAYHSSWRIKPKTIIINGHVVPEPVWDVGSLTHAYLVDISRHDYCVEVIVTGPHLWGGILQRGVIHATREAAEIHAKALLSFTEKK